MFISSARVLFLLLFCGAIHAHEVRPSLLKLTEFEPGSWHAEFKQPQDQGRFLNLKVITNCESTVARQRMSGSALQESFDLNCRQEPLRMIRIEGLDRTLSDTMVTLAPMAGDSRSYLISSNDIVLMLDAAEPAIPIYLLLGIEHLLLGIDHVLFVLVLLTIVSGWKNLLKVVTSFTVAHSITLGLSAFEIVTVSQAPVEAMIALSIVLLAWESLKEKTGLIKRTPWLIAFAFGLLHGLGFASALAEIGLPQFGALVALLLFNIGIELGQLIVIGIALGGAFLYRRMPWKLDYQVAVIGLYLIGGVASYWAIDRLWLIFA